jgi:hypothetical protein
MRGELAANITNDFAGNDGTVYNPSILWSLGFDRDIAVGDTTLANVNLQVNEQCRLRYGSIGDNAAFDCEGGLEPTFTRVTLVLSRSFLQDELEIKARAIWTIEDKDCYIMPSVVWTRDAVRAELAAGLFAGNDDGEMGYYWNNSFVKALIAYSF